MRFLPLGGGHEVGASCYFLELARARLLIDAGIRVHSKDAGINADALPDLAFLSAVGKLDAILITHAHLDHIGALPLIHNAFPATPIYATAPTVHLMRVLLADALKLMAQKAEQERECPLYDADLVGRLFTRVIPLPLGKSIAITDSVRAHFFPAGHILGAAMIGLESNEGAVLISGDISLGNQRTIPGLAVPRLRPHLLVLEATYGNRLHANRQQEEKGLVEAVAGVVAGGGHALVPAFALGRAQEVILLLQAYQQAGRVPAFPIWVDGMVRSVCQTYLNFPEYLQGPVKRVVLNGQNPFYREKSSAQAVSVAAQREKVLSGAPCCIVASSGMLTGGPAQFYAARLAGEEKNAILLCGYQDEESPGHQLLTLAETGDGELLLNGILTRVKCRVAKYGLSAHADAGELSSLAGQLKPRRVVLVHGENEARRALAEQLSFRHAVNLPDNGEELQFSFRRKNYPAPAFPWLKSPAGEKREREIDLAELWKFLNEQNQAKQLYTAEELATLWYGTAVSPAQQELTRQLLAEDRRYFAADWKHPYFYRPRRPELVSAEEKREQLMARLGHLPGHLVLAKNASGAVRAGICFAVDNQGFAAWKIGEEETFHPAEGLLEIIAPWPFAQDPPVPREEKILLHKLLSRARPVIQSLPPRLLWEKLTAREEKAWSLTEIENLIAEEKIPVSSPHENESASPDENESAIVYRLAAAFRLNAHPEYFERLENTPGQATYRPRKILPDELPPEETCSDEIVDRMEQNAALSLVDTMFPPGSGLYRKGVDRQKGKITLYFHFPQAAAVNYREELAGLAASCGWEIELHPEAHHGALNEMVSRLLPEGWTLLKTPSIYREDRQVVVRCLSKEGQNPEEFTRAADEFEKITGYRLVLAQTIPVPPAPASPLPATAAAPDRQRMEINQAYALIKNCLQSAGATVYRTGKKTGTAGEYIEVTLISPQIGEKYRSVLTDLAGKTGWELRINPEPNQNEIKNLVRSRLPVEWGMKKEPGFFKDRQEIRIKLASPPAPEDPAWQNLTREIYEATGYKLIYEN